MSDGWTISNGDTAYLDRLSARGVLDDLEAAQAIADAGGNPCPNARPFDEALAALRAIHQAHGAPDSTPNPTTTTPTEDA